MTIRKLMAAAVTIVVLYLAYEKEDRDARWCVQAGGVVEIDFYPHQPANYLCKRDGETVRSWRHENGRNVLIWERPATPTHQELPHM